MMSDIFFLRYINNIKYNINKSNLIYTTPMSTQPIPQSHRTNRAARNTPHSSEKTLSL
jgi:hypothetical protein